MGPMLCSDDNAASYFRVNAFSAWANNIPGIMWWCGFEQSELMTRPYTDSMSETELGLFNLDFKPKPVVKAIKDFSDFIRNLDFELPEAEKDAVCLLSRKQDQWGVAYMTYSLAKKVGLNLKFAYVDDEIPDAKLYLLPSIEGPGIMHRKQYDKLRDKVRDGADLYVSMNNAVLSGFDDLVGLRVIDSYEFTEEDYTVLNGQKIMFNRNRKYITEETGADVLLRDSADDPLVTVNKYGDGRALFVNFPLEYNLFGKHNAFDGNDELIYKELFADYMVNKSVKSDCDEVDLTFHKNGDTMIAVAVNYSENTHKLYEVADSKYVFDKEIYGRREIVKPYDACVLKYKIKQ